MTNCFDLEQKIMECWNVTSDINTLAEGISNHDLTNDEITNVLIGLNSLYNLKFDELFNVFEKLIADKQL